jgi:hypothetical protein
MLVCDTRRASGPNGRRNSVAIRVLLPALAIATCAATLPPTGTLFATCGDHGHERLYSFRGAPKKTGAGNFAIRIGADYSRVPGSIAHDARLVWTIDCGARSFVENSRLEYDKSGRVLARYPATRSMNIIPGSVADKLADKICR